MIGRPFAPESEALHKAFRCNLPDMNRLPTLHWLLIVFLALGSSASLTACELFTEEDEDTNPVPSEAEDVASRLYIGSDSLLFRVGGRETGLVQSDGQAVSYFTYRGEGSQAFQLAVPQTITDGFSVDFEPNGDAALTYVNPSGIGYQSISGTALFSVTDNLVTVNFSALVQAPLTDDELSLSGQLEPTPTPGS